MGVPLRAKNMGGVRIKPLEDIASEITAVLGLTFPEE